MAFFDELSDILSQTDPLTPKVICDLLAERWGGERIYIPRRCSGREQIDRADTPKTLMQRGIPRSTAYNWVNRWRS